MNEQKLFRQVALHFAMGAGLGALFMTSLFVLNIQNISNVVTQSTSPILVTVVLLIGCSMYFAFGAAITGFHFVITTDDNANDHHR